MKTRREQTGFSLVESLIAVLLVSIGLLGLASLQSLSLRNGNSAAQRVEATGLSYDLLDRMRANRAQALAGGYAVALGARKAGATLADTDVNDWKTELAAALPGGDGAVLMEGQVVTITVVWEDASNTDGDAASRLSLRTQL